MFKELKYFSIHNHTEYSNIRLKDSIVKPEHLIDYALELGYKGVCITDHACLSGHIKLLKYGLEKMKDNKDFKIGLGDEIYLVDSLEKVKDNYKSGVTKFPHFILLAKNLQGHRALREISSKSWSNLFRTGNMERVPTIKADLEEIMGNNKGNLIASTGCLGGELAILVKSYLENKTNENKSKIHDFITWCIKVFGKENFFIELQPSFQQEQIEFNKMALNIAKGYDLKATITTDTHYLKAKDKNIHHCYLNSTDGEREVQDFYASTYMMSMEEMYSYFEGYMKIDTFKKLINNSMSIYDMIEVYDLKQEVKIPQRIIPNFHLKHLFKDYYNEFEYLKQCSESQYEQDRYFLFMIEEGFINKKQELIKSNIARIDIELKEILLISEKLGQRMTSYYNLVDFIVDIMWDDTKGNSFVCPGRGSVTGFYTCYLIDITQMNPIEWDLPHWRHLVADRPELPDVDIDTEALKRQGIFKSLKEEFGFRRVLNIGIFKTEGSRGTILTCCRGLNIDSETASMICDLIPFERGKSWEISECLYGSDKQGEEKEAIPEFIKAVEKIEKLKETILKIEGLVCGRSIHASGVYIFQNDYIEQNSIMKAPNNSDITCWNMEDSDYCGSLKVDCLTVQALDKLRVSMELLLEYNKIKWQGNLRKTYEKYLHPNTLDYSNKDIWKLIGENKITDLFQFSTDVGLITSQKIKPENLRQLAQCNSIMRLMGDGISNPIDTYTLYKNDISLWYKEMKDSKLNTEEIKIMEKHLLVNYGLADTQEIVMEMVMNSQISGFNIIEANKLRKGIAKKKGKILDEVRNMFYIYGEKLGTSKNLLDYVWNVQIKRQLGYSFSKNHTMAYSVVALQEMNIYYHYNSLFWNCACLTVNSGASEEDEIEDFETTEEEKKKKGKNTDYGKIAKAISQMQGNDVKIALPNINKAKLSFSPNEQDNEIVFGLKAISSINNEISDAIISNRPYKSTEDFFDRMVGKGKPVSVSQCIKLIKGGCFDSFNNREEIMKDFIIKISETKNKLTFSNINMLTNYNCLESKYNMQVNYVKFKKFIFNKENLYVPPVDFVSTDSKINKLKKKIFYKIPDNINSEKFFLKHFADEVEEEKGWYYDENEKIIILESAFEKTYKKLVSNLEEYFKNDKQLLETLNNRIIEETYSKYASGNIAKWEMEALSFYYTEHELSNINKEKYNISNFSSLSEVPVVVGKNKTKKGYFDKFKIDRICGTVIDKNKMKHTVTLITNDSSIVTVKMYASAFASLNKQISKLLYDNNGNPILDNKGKQTKEIIEKSWFTRGFKILCTGFRRGDQFVPRVYSDTTYKKPVILITDVKNNGDMEFQLERKVVKGIEEDSD